MDCRIYDFVEGGGRVVEHGKGHWPNQLSVSLRPGTAWHIVDLLLAQLRRDPDKPVEITFLGELTEYKED